MNKILLIVIMLLSYSAFSKDYFVSTTGNDNNDGLTEATAWRTINFAAKKAKSGDTVWIKSGNYGNENVIVKNSGKEGFPISFIGYKTTTGDITSMYYTYAKGKPLDPKEMPMLDGGDRSKNTAINLTGREYISIKNIQITNYEKGLFSSNGNNLLIENIVAKTFGDVKSYSGRGIHIKGLKTKLINSIVINSAAVNIAVYGDNNLLENLSSYSNESLETGPKAATDYYITIRGNENIIKGCYVERVGNLQHRGHGISLKSVGVITENNLIENCTVINVKGAIEARHRQVKNNTFRNITIKGWKSASQNGGIVIHDGASYNTFENFTITGTNEAFRWYETVEDGGVQENGHHNIFKNIIVEDVGQLIYTGSMKDVIPLGVISNNSFENSTFVNINTLYGGIISFDNSNTIKNCIFTNIRKLNNKSAKYTPEWIENYNNYFNNGFEKPIGEGNISVNPEFEDLSNGNFRLKSTSKLIDAGKNLPDVKKDFDGNDRPQGKGHDIGAFEYKDNTSGSIQADAGEDQIICRGQSVTLTASGGSTYQWSTGSTTQSIEVNPTSTTTYSVTVSEEGKSSDTDGVTVTVNEIPEANAGQDVTINEGESVTLTASGGDTFLWSNGETTQSITVNPTKTTTYSVTVTKGGCEDIDSVEVLVKSSTQPIVKANAGEDLSICSGESVILTASGGSVYKWNTGETTKSIIVNPTETKIYTVTVSEGIQSDTDQIKVTVNYITADAGSNVTINEGESTVLTASGGVSYLWSSGETTQSITVNPVKTTTYTVTVTKEGCEDTDNVQISVNKNIIEDISPAKADAGKDVTICVGETITLSAKGGISYIWNTGDTKKDIIVSPKRTTQYTLKATRGGITDTDTVIVTVENCKNTFTKDHLNMDFIVFPNPTEGVLNINISSFKNKLNLILMTLNGSIIYSDAINPKHKSFTKQIDLSRFAKGVYFIRLFNANRNIVKKILLI
jgi:Secretion system C-terminal sorting domain